MNCCRDPLQEITFTRVRILAGMTLVAFASLLEAQTLARVFPVSATRATLVVTQSPDVLINGSAHRLSPGARIRGANNLLVMPATITGQLLQVKFVPDAQGLIHEVWILNSQETLDSRP
jgi:hypothetical protein